MNKLLTAATITLSLFATQANAGIVNIAGVTLAPGAQFWVSTLFESQLINVTDTLYGVGYVNAINGPAGPTWTDGTNGKQLAYYFSGYSVDSWYGYDGAALGWHGGTDNGIGAYTFSTQALLIDFSGGSVQFYADAAGTLNPYSTIPLGALQQAADITAATSGTLWADYAAQTFDYLTSQGLQIGHTLYASNGASSANSGGTGIGYLNVTAVSGVGAANSTLDTNGFTTLTSAGVNVIADAQLYSTYTNTNPVGYWPLTGSVNLKTTAVPAPGSIFLFGLGLLGLGVIARKRTA